MHHLNRVDSRLIVTATIAVVLSACGGGGGSSTDTTIVTVADAPTIGAATAASTSADIEFGTPADNGGAAITSYEATCVGASDSASATDTSSPITVAGLSNDTTYDCSVTATNSAGTSSASARVSVTTQTALVSDADFEATDWTEASHSNDVDPNSTEVFDDTMVKRFDFVVTEERWQLMLDDMTTLYGEFGQRATGGLIDTDADPVFVPADVYYEGTQWYRVGIRFKGNSSLQGSWQEGNLKLSFKMDFDEFEDDYPQIDNQRFYGFKKFSLKNNYDDPSQLREKVAADVFAKAGLAVSHTGFYTLYIDHGNGPEYFGLYTLVEEVDGEVLDTQFSSDDGNLYKPEEGGANFVEGEFAEEFFEKKTNEDEADWSDIQALFAALHDNTASTDPASWRESLEAVFDVDIFLKYLAVNGIIQNWDTYGKMTHNFYLYNDPATEKLTWIPWDNNEALQEGKRGGALALDFANIEVGGWPLIENLIADEVYKARYDAYLSEVIGFAFDTTTTQALYDTYSNLIESFATTERAGYSFLRGPNDFSNAIADLKQHASSRATAVETYLDAQ
ncbi:MAG: CotH kinase family protein [Congregibacter sp.]